MKTPEILVLLGYIPGQDFIATQENDEVAITWLNNAPLSQDEIDAATPLVIRKKVRDQINAERNRREQAGFPFAGKWIDSDAVSVQRITVATNTAQMALAAGVPYELQWACWDNTLITLDAMGVLGMMQALGTYGLALHMHARALKAAVDASDDPESIDILAGWPE